MTAPNTLGEYLRARRELVDPAAVGLRVAGVRRTPGLRREEVATLAGISADYYLRLEQGRDRNPSPPVIEALAKVFGLDPIATDYLLSLVASQSAVTRARHARRTPQARRTQQARRTPQAGRARQEIVPAGIKQLIAAVNLPAFVESRLFDVLAANQQATALSPSIAPGENRLRSLFLDRSEQDLYPDWPKEIGGMVASFRASIGPDPDAAAIAQLVGELSLASEPFRKLWARHDVRALAGAPIRLNHPQAGLLDLRREKLPIGDSGGQLLVMYHAAPGSASARALASLVTATAENEMATGRPPLVHSERTGA